MSHSFFSFFCVLTHAAKEGDRTKCKCKCPLGCVALGLCVTLEALHVQWQGLCCSSIAQSHFHTPPWKHSRMRTHTHTSHSYPHIHTHAHTYTHNFIHFISPRQDPSKFPLFEPNDARPMRSRKNWEKLVHTYYSRWNQVGIKFAM